jgi:hypothetical protein
LAPKRGLRVRRKAILLLVKHGEQRLFVPLELKQAKGL